MAEMDLKSMVETILGASRVELEAEKERVSVEELMRLWARRDEEAAADKYWESSQMPSHRVSRRWQAVFCGMDGCLKFDKLR